MTGPERRDRIEDEGEIHGTEPRTLCDIFLAAAACGKPSLLISKVGGAWKPISAADFGFTVRALSLGLNGLGIQPGDRVAILSENRPEWAMADYAILCAGAWSVPIYPTLPAAQVAPLLNDCGAKAIFVSTLEQLGKILTIKAQCPSLDHVILIEGSPPGAPGYTTFHGVVDRGRPTLEMSPGVFEQRAARVKPDDVATIIYTSGTTGEPKGAMLTHGNFVSNVVTGCEVIPFAADAIALSFLPLSHVFERMLDYAYLYRTAAIAYAESIDKLAANFLEVNPHCFGAVPRVYEKVHARIMAKVEAGSAPEEEALRLGGRASGGSGVALPGARRAAAGRPRARRAKIADALVLKKIRRALGTDFALRRLRRRAAVARSRRVLLRRRRPDLRGLRPDRDLAGHLRQRPRPLAARARSAGRCPASRSGSPRTARS